MSWRLVLGDGSGLVPLAGATNMAIDLALLESVQAGGSPVLRFYRWSPACLSFGRNQCARDTYDPVVVAACSIDVVRRPTGGLAVLHDAEVTYSVIAPIGAIGRPREAYVRINAWLVAALREFGVAAVLAPPLARGGVPAGGEPCFARPAAGEVVAGGRKLIGSAQRCERHCILQHGSILLDGDQRRVHRLERVAPGRTTPAGSPAEGGSISLRELTGRAVAADELVEILTRTFAAFTGTALAPARPERAHSDRVAHWRAHFASATWTWRR